IDGYSRLARLSKPAKQVVHFAAFLEGVRPLYPFVMEGSVPTRPGFFDPAQMQQVLINLMKNAIESGSPAEEVALAIEFPADGGVELAVLDRGAGMSDEVLKRAMVPFYSTKKTGTGLGLSLCREILEAHDGTLSIHPRPGGGTRVRCWLPIADDAR